MTQFNNEVNGSIKDKLCGFNLTAADIELLRPLTCTVSNDYTRNYNGSIEVPAAGDVLPDELQNIYFKIEDKVRSYINNESEKIVAEMGKISGFIQDVPKKRIEFHERLKKIVSETPHFQEIISTLNQLVNTHPFFTNDEN